MGNIIKVKHDSVIVPEYLSERDPRITNSLKVSLPFDGNIEKCLYFDGVNDYVDLGQPPSIDFSGSFTISAWVKPYISPPAAQIFFSAHSQLATQESIHLRIYSDGSVRFGFYSNDISTVPGVIVFGSWNFISAVYNYPVDISTIYVNGIFSNSSGYGPFLGTSPTLRIGSWANSEFFKGNIREVRIWNTARTESEIQESMYRKLSGFETGLVAYYPMNEGRNKTVYDKTLNKNHGTMTGTTVNTGPIWIDRDITNRTYDSMTNWYPLRENANDAYGNNGTVTGATLDTTNYDGGYVFDSTTEKITLASSISSTNVTVSLYYRYDGNLINSHRCLIGRTSGSAYYHLFIQTGGNELGTWNNGWVGTGFNLTKGKEYHIVLSKSGTNQKIWVDGNLIQSISTSFDNASYPIQAIGNSYSTSYSADGRIRDVKFFNKYISDPRELELKSLSTRNGLYVGKAMTNRYTNLNFNIYDNHALANKSLTLLKETFRGYPIYRLAMKPTATEIYSFRSNFNSHGVRTVHNFQFTSGEIYHSSIYWRPVNKPDTEMSGTPSNVSGWQSNKTVEMEDGWKRTCVKWAGAETRTDNKYWAFRCPSAEADEWIYIDFTCMTFETAGFASEYILGSRTASDFPMIDLPYVPPFTIFFRFRGNQKVETIIDQGSSPMICHLGDAYYSNGSISFWNYVKGLRTYAKGITSSGWTLTKTYFTYNSSTWDDVEHSYAIIIAEDKRTIKVYMDGIYLGQGTSTEDLYPFNGNKMILGRNIDGFYRDFAIYGRELAENEIKTLHKASFRANEFDEFDVIEIEEKPKLPENTHTTYFPLAGDALSSDKVYSPSTATNLTFEENALWVGNASTNLANVGYVGGWDNAGTAQRLTDHVVRLYDGVKTYSFIKLTDGSSCIETSDTSVSPSTVYSASIWAWYDCPIVESDRPYFRQYHSTGNNSLGYLTYEGQTLFPHQFPQKRWIKLKIENVTTNSTATNLRLVQYLYKGGNTVHFTAPMIEQKSYITPFVNGTRAASELYYSPDPRGIIDVSKEFTIFGWFKPSIVITTNYTPVMSKDNGGSNRLLIMGESSNPCNMRAWYGDGTNSTNFEVINSKGPVSAGKWQFFCLRRMVDRMYLFHGMDGVLSMSGNNSAGTYLDNQTNVNNWRFGQWSTGTGADRLNGFIKDYTFIQSAISDSVIEQIFRTKLSILNDKLLIPTRLIEES
jgi:hypothetical protein